MSESLEFFGYVIFVACYAGDWPHYVSTTSFARTVITYSSTIRRTVTVDYGCSLTSSIRSRFLL